MTLLPRFENDLVQALRAAAPAIVEDRPARSPAAARRRRRQRVLAWPAIAAVATAVVVAALALSPERPSPQPAVASAATLLRLTATAQTTLAHGYVYTRWTFRSTVGPAARHAGTQEQWADRRGRGRRIVRGGGRPPSTTRLTGRVPVGLGEVGLAELTRIATDPAALARWIDAQARQVVGLPRAQARAFTTYQLLESALITDAPAPVRAALLRRLATAPGLHRAGSAATLTIGDVRFTLRLDEARVVGTERRLLRRSRQFPGPPRVLDAWRLTASGTVAHVGDRP